MSLLKMKSDTEWDLASLGEVMLRFDPGAKNAFTMRRNFRVWEGGGEYNVARGLSKVFQERKRRSFHLWSKIRSAIWLKI